MTTTAILGLVLGIVAAILPVLLKWSDKKAKDQEAANEALQRNNLDGLAAIERRVRELQGPPSVP